MTLPMKVAPEGATILLRALRAFRAGAQYALDTILVKRLYRRVKDSYKVASLARLHKLLYGELKTRFGLPSRLAIDAIRYARSVAMTWLNNPNRGKRPRLKKLCMTLTKKQGYTLWLDNRKASILTPEGRVRCGVIYVERWHGKYADWEMGEAKLTYRRCRFRLHIVVKKDVDELQPKAILGVDRNIKNVVITVVSLDGRVLHQEMIPLRGIEKAIEHKKRQERLQKRYPRAWRFLEGVKGSIRKHGARQHNRPRQEMFLVAKRLEHIALQYHAWLAQEDLTGLSANTGVEKVRLWAYRQLGTILSYKLAFKGVRTILVKPEGTSSCCPCCGSRVKRITYHRLVCPRCGREYDRDLMASWNIALRALKAIGCGASQAALSAPDADENPSAMRGKLKNGGQAMAPVFQQPVSARDSPPGLPRRFDAKTAFSWGVSAPYPGALLSTLEPQRINSRREFPPGEDGAAGRFSPATLPGSSGRGCRRDHRSGPASPSSTSPPICGRNALPHSGRFRHPRPRH